jgi:cell surface protein SprA
VQTTNAFSTDPTDRPFQDEGFDGLNDAGEQTKFSSYLSRLAVLFGSGSAIYQKAAADPAADDYLNYRAPYYDSTQTQIVGRYKNINNPQGNSPIAPPGATYVDASTLYPDQEDLDHDNTMNELEEYFEYKVDLTPSSVSQVGTNFISDSRTFVGYNNVIINLVSVPDSISAYSQKVGNIPDFKSIRFIRMYMNGWTDSVVCRFAEFQLIRDSWRTLIMNWIQQARISYTCKQCHFAGCDCSEYEQNSTRTPIPCVIHWH